MNRNTENNRSSLSIASGNADRRNFQIRNRIFPGPAEKTFSITLISNQFPELRRIIPRFPVADVRSSDNRNILTRTIPVMYAVSQHPLPSFAECDRMEKCDSGQFGPDRNLTGFHDPVRKMLTFECKTGPVLIIIKTDNVTFNAVECIDSPRNSFKISAFPVEPCNPVGIALLIVETGVRVLLQIQAAPRYDFCGGKFQPTVKFRLNLFHFRKRQFR